MPATIEVLPLCDDEPISIEAVMFKHRGCLGEASARRLLANDRYTLRCTCGLEVTLLEDAPGQLLKMAIGVEPHDVKEHTISTVDGPIHFKVQGEPNERA